MKVKVKAKKIFEERIVIGTGIIPSSRVFGLFKITLYSWGTVYLLTDYTTGTLQNLSEKPQLVQGNTDAEAIRNVLVIIDVATREEK